MTVTNLVSLDEIRILTRNLIFRCTDLVKFLLKRKVDKIQKESVPAAPKTI